EDIMALGGFYQEPSRFSGTMRATRVQDGVQQMVTVVSLEEGERWRWANLYGPATIVTVKEFPLENPAPAPGHRVPDLMRPPLPPDFPPHYAFVKGLKLRDIFSDPIIPRNFRESFGIQVRLTSDTPQLDLASTARSELTSPGWKTA